MTGDPAIKISEKSIGSPQKFQGFALLKIERHKY